MVEGSILCSWRRPASHVEDQAIQQLSETVTYIKSLRDRSAQNQQSQQSQNQIPSFGGSSSSLQNITSYELQVNKTGNHIGGVLIVRGDVDSLHALQADDEWSDRVMRLVALFEDFETNVCIGGPDDRSIKEAVRVYRTAFQDLATSSSGSSRRSQQ